MKSSRTQKGAMNAAVSVSMHFVSLLINFISRTVFLAYMQSEYLGINGLFSNILTVLSLAELGIGDALVYALYRPMREQNWDELDRLIGFAKRAYRVLACVVAVIGIGVSFFLEHLIAEPPVIQENLRIIFFFYLANSVCSYLLAYKSLILTADQSQYISSLISQGAKILQQFLQILVLVLFGSFYLYLLCQVVCTILNNATVWWIINRRYPNLRRQSAEQLPRDKLTKIKSDMASLSVSKIAGVIANGTDNIIISKMIGLIEAGLVSNYTLITNAVNGILWQGVRALMGSIGNFNADSTQEQRRCVFDQLMILCYGLYAIACVCIVVLSGPFVDLCWGAQYVLEDKTVFALALILYVTGVNFPAYSFRVTMGEFSKIKYFHLAAGILNLVVSVALAPGMGVFGVFLATSVTRIFTSELMDGYLVSVKILGRTFFWYAKQYVGFFLAFCVNIWLSGKVVDCVSVPGVWGFVLKALTCVLCSGMIFLACFGWTEPFLNLVGRGRLLLKELFSKNSK